jgi:hypothetical protein
MDMVAFHQDDDDDDEEDLVAVTKEDGFLLGDGTSSSL